MEKDGGYVIEDGDKIVGYFAFLPSPEPTYARIYEGKWLDDMWPYHVVHRIASYPQAHGIFSSMAAIIAIKYFFIVLSYGLIITLFPIPYILSLSHQVPTGVQELPSASHHAWQSGSVSGGGHPP